MVRNFNIMGFKVIDRKTGQARRTRTIRQAKKVVYGMQRNPGTRPKH
jgi:hypothetical protein